MNTISKLKAVEHLPVIVADEEGMILFVNKRFEETYHWNSLELQGKTLTTLIPKVLKDAHLMGFSRFRVTQESEILNQPLRLEILTGDGREMIAEHFIVAERHGGNWFFGATITPISSKETE
jgi:PAS domain S-box-containing protein